MKELRSHILTSVCAELESEGIGPTNNMGSQEAPR